MGSAAPLLGAAVGAFLAAHDHAGAPVERATAAACASDLPAAAARCATDRAVADVGPIAAQALLGGAVGLAVAVVLVLLVGRVARTLRRGGGAPPQRSVPSWVVLPRTAPAPHLRGPRDHPG